MLETLWRKRLPLLVGMLVFVSSDIAEAGPITFNSGLQVSPGVFIWREQVVLFRSSDDPSPADRDLRVLAVPSVLAYGVTRNLTLFGIVPYLNKTLDLTTPAGRIRRTTQGIGDGVALARYTIYRLDDVGETIRIAPLLGLKFPTGDDDERDQFGRIPQPLQLGSGSWDPMVGTIFTWQTLQWEFDSAFEYTFRTPANNFEFGDVAELDASFQYRIWPFKVDEGVPAFVYVVLESNLFIQGKNEIQGRKQEDSGGTSWFLAPGLQFVSKRWVFESVVQLPVVQDLNGQALENDYIFRIGFRFNFDVPTIR